MPLPWQSTWGTRIIPDFAVIVKNCLLVALNSLMLGVLKINLIRKFYTFLISQININFALLRIKNKWQFDWRGCSPAAHTLKPPLFITIREVPGKVATALIWFAEQAPSRIVPLKLPIIFKFMSSPLHSHQWDMVLSNCLRSRAITRCLRSLLLNNECLQP